MIEHFRRTTDPRAGGGETAAATGGDDGAPVLRPPARRALMRHPGLVLLALAALAAVIVLGLRARGPVVATAAVTRMDLEQHLVASGRVRVVTRVQISAETTGRVSAVRVREGGRVRAGALLVRLDDRDARAAVAEARAAVARAEAGVEGLRDVSAMVTAESVRQAEAAEAQVEEELARLELLAKSGAVARADVDEARRQVEIARARTGGAKAEAGAARPEGAQTRAAVSRAQFRTNDLSGGQQQRVATARALVRRPPLVLSYEPTGNFDTASSDDVFELMRRFNRELGTTFLVVTHDSRITERCSRVVELVDGRITSDRRQ